MREDTPLPFGEQFPPVATAEWTALIVLVFLALSGGAAWQQPDLRTSSTTVLFDVVVRDTRGFPVEDLALREFEVKEDGVKQRPTAVFRRQQADATHTPGVTARASADAGGAGAGHSSLQLQEPVALAFVFDQLSPEGRALSVRVAETVMARLQADVWVGVYALEQQLVAPQSFTLDRAAATEGVRRVAMRPSHDREAGGGAPIASGRGDISPRVSPTAGAESEGGLPTTADRIRRLEDLPVDGPEWWLARMEARMAAGYDRMLRDQQGRIAVDALRGVVGAMAQGNGRKSIVLFSEGVPTSDQARLMLDTLIATANRAGVTFYVVDAAGLRAHSTIAATARELDVAGREALGDVRRNEGAWTKDLERQADLLRSDGTSSLARLAKETGGVLLENSNGVEAMATRLEQDQRSQYVIAYTSTRPTLDGSYRKVTVKVQRKGATAVHRSGYWAVAIPADQVAR